MIETSFKKSTFSKVILQFTSYNLFLIFSFATVPCQCNSVLAVRVFMLLIYSYLFIESSLLVSCQMELVVIMQLLILRKVRK